MHRYVCFSCVQCSHTFSRMLKEKNLMQRKSGNEVSCKVKSAKECVTIRSECRLRVYRELDRKGD